MGVNSFPTEPWDLHGHAYVGVWLLPRGLTPPAHSPMTKILRVFGRTIVSAAFFRYDEPSPLTYNEIMSTVLVRHGLRPRVSITHIWVDSEASRDGGRALWAIPKDLADFERASHRSYVATGIGSLSVRRARRLPFSIPLTFHTAQDRDGALVVSQVKGRARLGLARGAWSFEPGGPLGFLAGRRPLLSLTLHPFHLAFGRR
ncbi:MAG: acetoacetate decarboxylase family protein [Aeromicrobium sp.]